MLYFTDGYGVFPEEAPPYPVAFVMLQYRCDDINIPRWAKTLTVTPKRTIKFKDDEFYGKGVEMVYEAKVVDANGIPRLLAPGQKVRVYINCWGELQDHIWIADEEDRPLGMANRIKSAFWADPEAIKEAAKAKLVDMAEVLHDTRSRNWEAAAEKIALEAGRKILVEVAKEQAAEPPRKVGVKSADVLGIASEPPACEEDEEAVEEAFNPLSIR